MYNVGKYCLSLVQFKIFLAKEITKQLVTVINQTKVYK
ncbi:hypothetical protein RINTHH_8340 [Richelia intracellularis HH01]|uniref:Uncharacterized protein n=1 Tax=Richelia intracellularis HH01 TaxID=1165094 RepID=M1WRK7_9NOST|nr:hypothetical protein RINTHH_8340 [Richelia intracellularis HH01]